MEEFSDPVYRVDVLKVEFPVGAAYADAWSKSEALEWFRAVDSATPLPYIYLSAGVGIADFTSCLRLAAEAGARFSGVLCGRATWQDGVAVYATSEKAALSEWLATAGVRNVRAINECLKAATPWSARA
jgi:tagatose 1,6-diphosphate aldolase